MATKNSVQKTIATYNKAAKKYQDKFMTLDLYNDVLDKFCNAFSKKNASIFEIATGPGNVTKYLLNQKPDFNIFGIDLAENMIDLAKKNNPKANFKVMDCKDINTIHQKFDGIMCSFCMPYLSKEEVQKLIADASNLLHPSGLFYISTMEDDYDKSGFETTSFAGDDIVYIYYHQASYLNECLKKSGFTIVETQRKDYPEANGTITTDLIIIAQKNSM